MIDVLSKYYEWLFTDLADPRTQHMLLMPGPFPLLLILSFYLYLIKIKLPKWMEDKKAFDLKSTISIYNGIQIILNTFIFLKFLKWGWKNYKLECIPMDYSNAVEDLNLAKYLHKFFLLKVIELVETVFFILRKKNEQASFLHVYHHSITAFTFWMAVKYIPGGLITISITMNAFVHIVMYSYYEASTLADEELRKKLNKWKPLITIMQMAQFTFVFFHTGQALLPSCKVSKALVIYFLPNLLTIYYLFWDFYKKTYMKSPSKTHNIVMKTSSKLM